MKVFYDVFQMHSEQDFDEIAAWLSENVSAYMFYIVEKFN